MLEATDTLSLAEAATLFPKRNGKPLSLVAMRRRVVKGVDGVRLRAIRDGRVWFTTREWVEQFQAEVTRRRLQDPCVSRSESVSAVRARLRMKHGF